LTALLLFSALSQATAASKELGMIDSARIETAPALELNKLITSHPTDKLFVVTAVSQLNSNVTDRYKWFYDAELRVLVLMQRTSMKTMNDVFVWRIWHNILPKQFVTRLPYGDSTIKSTASPYTDSVQAFAKAYTKASDLVKWP
jgi:hypothetical protein